MILIIDYHCSETHYVTIII